MKQVVAAIAALAILVAVVIAVSMWGGEEEAATVAVDEQPAVVSAEAAVETGAGGQPEDGVAATEETGSGELAADAAPTAASNGEAEAATVGEGAAGAAPSGDPADGTRPSFDVVRVERDGAAVMAGRATPGARVEILSGDGVLAETTADERGEWVVVLEESLAGGEHEIWLRAQGVDGLTTESGEAVVMTVPQGADGGGDEQGDVLAVTVPREGEGAVTVLQAPADGVGISGGGALVLESLSYGDGGTLTLSGKADPGAEVRPYVDGVLAGTATAGGDGDWTLTLSDPLDTGLHDLRIDQVAPDGTVTARLETPMQRAAFAMPTSSEPLIVIQPGNNLWVIARHVYGQGILYTQIFEANRAQIVDPDLIYPGQIFILPDAAAAGG